MDMKLLLSALVVVFAVTAQARPATTSPRELVVCADPNDLPMSNRKLQGFENRIAALIAADLHATLRYAWYPQQRSFLRKTLKAGLCDVVMGIPTGLQGIATTRPYYTSTYVFVTARQRHLQLSGFDDPALRSLKIGLPMIGAEGSNPPPASALAVRGLAANVVGYRVWDGDSEPSPQRRIVGAVAKGEIDTAIIWGPVGGYFARQYRNKLTVNPVYRDPQLPDLTFAYDIAAGVRRGDDELRAQLQVVLDRRRTDIEAILKDYGVPLVHTSARAAANSANDRS
jgi:mxaJ protein